MRQPTPSERKLLWALIAAVFVALNLGAMRLWTTFMDAQNRALNAAKATLEEGRGWILAAEGLGDTIRSLPQPPQFAERDASSTLLREVRSAASSGGLTIMEESLPPPPVGLPEDAVAVRVKLGGPFSGLVRFLFAIQQPDAWRAIENMTVKADATPQNVLAELEIRQYYDQSAPGVSNNQVDPSPGASNQP
ncbi:MAG: hypothetical protein Fur0032_19740 [Terrimicrobiaceae bacterium]